LKTFYDSVFINGSSLYQDPEYPIKLEYYKTIHDEKTSKAQYGIQIVKTEFVDGKVNVESEELENITNNQEEIEELLGILRNNTVTPFGLQEILDQVLVNK